MNSAKFKWSEKRKARAPKARAAAYPEAAFQVINPANCQELNLP